MAKKKGAKPKPQEETIRLCANIRSKKHPDSRCTLSATHGEFCSRHYKNPVRFKEDITLTSSNSFKQLDAASKIQSWWKSVVGIQRFKRQGPCTTFVDLAENNTDIYTLDPIQSIPVLYRWSYPDAKKHLWVFDVRSLSMTRAEDSREGLLNPYTREPLQEKYAHHFLQRCQWLRDRKYCIVHTFDTGEMTAEQIWHQRILDVTMKYDILGYHTCLSWFEELNLQQLALFYTELWELWYYRLHLSPAVKNQVVPNWHKHESLLFKWSPQEIRNRNEKKWWQKTMLELLDRLVSSAELKEHKTLGALYGMTAFAIVSSRVRNSYPWLVEMPGDEF